MCACIKAIELVHPQLGSHLGETFWLRCSIGLRDMHWQQNLLHHITFPVCSGMNMYRSGSLPTKSTVFKCREKQCKVPKWYLRLAYQITRVAAEIPTSANGDSWHPNLGPIIRGLGTDFSGRFHISSLNFNFILVS